MVDASGRCSIAVITTGCKARLTSEWIRCYDLTYFRVPSLFSPRRSSRGTLL